MAVDEGPRSYEHPLYARLEAVPGLSVGTTTLDALLTWGTANSLWMFPMATSCCGIEFMHANASRVDLDQMGSVVRPSPRHCDVMVVAGTITVKMAPRVKKLWDQMPEPKWCIAMGSCAISGDFYRDIYSVVPGIDTFLPVDVYIPGCPPNADQLMVGLKKLQERIELQRRGELPAGGDHPARPKTILPDVGRLGDPRRSDGLSRRQAEAARDLGLGGGTMRRHDTPASRQGGIFHPDEE